MSNGIHKRTSSKASTPGSHSQYGVPLGRSSLRALEQRGIYCQPGVSLEHQHLSKRYVLRGVESGGSVADMGRHCSFLNIDGTPIQWLQPIDSISGNGRHAVVVSASFVRIDMFRVGRTYELAITEHTLQVLEGHAKPSSVAKSVFRGRDGTLPFDLTSPEHRNLRGTIVPSFYSASGELRKIPRMYEDAVKKATAALNCIGCKHIHIAVSPRS